MIFRFYLLLILLFNFNSCNSNINLEFLEGIWKVENKDNYEAWRKSTDGFIGEGYRMRNGEKQITEKLAVKKRKGMWFYEATVLNQNDGQTVSFKLNQTREDIYLFENLNHDFPKKISYKKVSDSEVFVEVLGDGNKGFSFTMRKQ